ncbi:adenosylcobinamide-GDP ribazoletransferase [Paracoccus sp. p3-h83]|uniref:adenosylcobinamide-GDP ribazoletransferase n=1 Tax=Paracoccus sp. p3-h83 TaxID=3342805 RepID=UPI0035BA1B39
MMRPLAEVQAALMLLTRLPVGRVADPFPAMRDTVWAFPLVGLVTGGAMAGAMAAGLALGWPAAIAALIALTLGPILTGALHEDGLADCADAMGGQGRDRRLAILKDSRIGSFGALALILSVGLRVQGYAALGTLAPLAMLALAVASRAPMAVLLALLPPARADGLGAAAARPTPLRVIVAATIGAVGAICIGGPVTLVAIALATLAVAWAARRTLGGQTGDVLGACQQVCEIAGLLALLAINPA